MPEICSFGIDIGSTTTKIVGINENKKIIWHLYESTDPHTEKQIKRFIEKAKERSSSIEKIPIVTTGYGRNLSLKATKKITEITCHACGIYHLFEKQGTLIDIGGQDTKVISIGEKGKVLDFIMNDKCASGTGRFLENISLRLKIPLEKFGEVALSTNSEVQISSTCSVFADTEVISLLAKGVKVEEIVRGIHRAFIKRIVSMVRIVGLRPPLFLSGGVALNRAVSKLIEEEIKEKVITPEFPHLIGAFGAAITALRERVKE